MLIPPRTAHVEAPPLVADSPDVRVHVNSRQPIIRAGIQCLLEAHTDSRSGSSQTPAAVLPTW